MVLARAARSSSDPHRAAGSHQSALGRLEPAARLQSRRSACHLPRSRHHHDRSVIQCASSGQYRHPAALDRRVLVRGARLVEPGPLSGLERHPQQSPDALPRRRWARDGVPVAIEQQQRQRVRFRGTTNLLRARRAPGCPLRTRRIDRRDCRRVRRQAAQLAKRCRGSSGRQHLVHRSAVWRVALRGAGRRAGRTEQPARPVEREGRTAGRSQAR